MYRVRNEVPYIVLIGDVGSGKSTIIEKLTGKEGRSSNSDTSFTKTSQAFWVTDRSMKICDTPGSNGMNDKLTSNVWIAAALRKFPVSRILVVVKADTRIDNVVDGVRKYAEKLIEFDPELIGVLVTHMDTVNWTGANFKTHLRNELGIDVAVFSSLDHSSEALLRDLHDVCLPESREIMIDNETFVRVFKINNNNLKILNDTAKIIAEFKDLKRSFDETRKLFNERDQVDLIFEFQAFMFNHIIVAQQRLAEENNFSFLGRDAANEAGHIANMTNQLRLEMYHVRLEAMGYYSNHGVAEARRCPHCNLVWAKVEGCDGQTTCGNRPSVKIDVRNQDFGILGSYEFSWICNKLQIVKKGTKKIEAKTSSSPIKQIGCGASITWDQMPPVTLPDELISVVTIASADDVKSIPSDLPGVSQWERELTNKMDNAVSNIFLE